MPLNQGRMYIVRFADSFSGSPTDSDSPNFLFASGLYEGDIEKDDVMWVTLTNWWSPSDIEHDVREVAYVLRESIVEYWDVTPSKPGINLKKEDESIDGFMAEIDEDTEEAMAMNVNPPPQFEKEETGGLPPYHG